MHSIFLRPIIALFEQTWRSKEKSPPNLSKNAKKKTDQNRNQSRRQRRTRTIPQTRRLLLLHNHHRHHRRCRRLSPPPPRHHHRGCCLQISTHRPLQINQTKTLKMEVEVKLRLPNEETHNRLKAILSPHHIRTETQQNYFFDTDLSSLASNRAVLRIRFVNNDQRCVLSLKAKPVLVNGVSRVEEDEEEIDPKTGRQCVSEPVKLLTLADSRVIKRCLEEFGVREEMGFVCLGGFENVREVYEWKNGLKLEVDRTTYGFGGVCFELECESCGDIEGVKGEIEEFLKENGIEFKDSEMSKFAVFRSGKLPS